MWVSSSTDVHTVHVLSGRTFRNVKLLPATSVLVFDSHKLNKSTFFIKSLANMIVSPCVRIFISTLVFPALARYGSCNLTIGGVLASCSISEIMGGNPTGGLKCFFQASLIANCSTCNLHHHSLNLIILIKLILASDCLVLSFFLHIHLVTSWKKKFFLCQEDL